MALQIEETWESRGGELGKNSEDDYIARVWGDPVADNADDPRTVTLFAAQHFAWMTDSGNILTSLRRDPQIGVPGSWIFKAHYANGTLERKTGDSAFSFTIGGGTKHITTSIQTVASYVSPDFTLD